MSDVNGIILGVNAYQSFHYITTGVCTMQELRLTCLIRASRGTVHDRFTNTLTDEAETGLLRAKPAKVACMSAASAEKSKRRS